MKIRSKAPLRLGLAGGGTDLDSYCNFHTGLVLNSTISLYVHCTIEETDDNKVVFEALDIDKKLILDSDLKYEINGEMDLFKGVYNKIVENYIKKPLSFKLTTYSDIASGSGLGGSSTLVVSIIKCFAEWLSLPLGDYDIAILAYEIEREDIKIVGGAQDMYSATFGGFNFIEFYDQKRVIVNPLRIKSNIINELESSLVLFFTNITRSASQIEDEKRRLLKKKKSLDAMHLIKKDAIKMKESILKGDIESVSKIIGNSWSNKKVVSKSVSNNYIDKVYDLALENGAKSGKVCGAGGGGFMFFMVDPLNKNHLIRVLNDLDHGIVINFKFVKEGTTSWRIS